MEKHKQEEKRRRRRNLNKSLDKRLFTFIITTATTQLLLLFSSLSLVRSVKAKPNNSSGDSGCSVCFGPAVMVPPTIGGALGDGLLGLVQLVSPQPDYFTHFACMEETIENGAPTGKNHLLGLIGFDPNRIVKVDGKSYYVLLSAEFTPELGAQGRSLQAQEAIKQGLMQWAAWTLVDKQPGAVGKVVEGVAVRVDSDLKPRDSAEEQVLTLLFQLYGSRFLEPAHTAEFEYLFTVDINDAEKARLEKWKSEKRVTAGADEDGGSTTTLFNSLFRMCTIL